MEALEGIIIDITQRKESELQLKRISELDLLTGLPNRRALRAVMAADSESGHYPKRAVVLFNLRRINTINAIYGFGFCEFCCGRWPSALRPIPQPPAVCIWLPTGASPLHPRSPH